ncbi:uncharacterized protein LY89DRAFT_335249 [Mollisia scopiformis]|uniref:Uncharacterized protein n=1 Tax=Mollisia scopiformis TaxID=149040 RepID=A0A132B884_MOLSC|nr:uncharacterized protein LY89DRAFT_335249 [Mollisia scopiformis]KUJ08618.1 hypothetical protein LY89DRAFT_335249 [Mollisia scopiformis]
MSSGGPRSSVSAKIGFFCGRVEESFYQGSSWLLTLCVAMILACSLATKERHTRLPSDF